MIINHQFKILSNPFLSAKYQSQTVSVWDFLLPKSLFCIDFKCILLTICNLLNPICNLIFMVIYTYLPSFPTELP